MKFSVKPNLLKYAVLGAGVLGLLLRVALYATAMDDQGLLIRNHPLQYLLWGLTFGVLIALVLLTRNITGPEDYRDAFPVSPIGGVGCLAATAGLLITLVGQLADPPDSTALILWAMTLLAMVCLALMGLCRLMGGRSFFLLPVALCIYFAVQMVSQYRTWSPNPQLQDYCFQLLACVCLMLTAYHHAAFGADMGRHRQLWFFSLASVYLCCLSLAGGEDLPLYLGTGIWAFTNITSLTAKQRRQRPNLNLEEERGPEEV